MKVNYAELQNRPRTRQSLTGLKTKEFEALLTSFKVAWSKIRPKGYRFAYRRKFGERKQTQSIWKWHESETP